MDARANGPEAGGEDTEGKGAEGRENTQKGRKRAAGEMGQTLDRWLRREGAEELGRGTRKRKRGGGKEEDDGWVTHSVNYNSPTNTVYHRVP